VALLDAMESDDVGRLEKGDAFMILSIDFQYDWVNKSRGTAQTIR
jgi:hypothetical protein